MAEHYFSLMKYGGRDCTMSNRVPMEQALALWTEHPELLGSAKGEGCLMAMGYDENREILATRKESQFTHQSLILIDCDNDHANPNLIGEFEEYMGKYEFVLWQSPSSTKECPKFRAVIPLTRPVKWTPYNKKAIAKLFPVFTDPKASWFEEPLRTKIDTVQLHHGEEFPAEIFEKFIAKIQADEERKQRDMDLASKLREQYLFIKQIDGKTYHQPKTPDVSQNEKVRHYLDTPYTKISGNGDSDLSLYRAICVCLTAGDEATLEQVRMKALGEKWSAHTIERKIKEARQFVGR